MSATKALEFFLDALDSDANSFFDYRGLKTYVQELEARKASISAMAVPKETSGNVVSFRRNELGLASSEYGVIVCSIFEHFHTSHQESFRRIGNSGTDINLTITIVESS
jgi:hypothetical protein